jgi:hypothetical protein
LEKGIGFYVNCGGSFVEYEDVGGSKERTGERDELTLTLGEVASAVM